MPHEDPKDQRDPEGQDGPLGKLEKDVLKSIEQVLHNEEDKNLVITSVKDIFDNEYSTTLESFIKEASVLVYWFSEDIKLFGSLRNADDARCKVETLTKILECIKT